MEPPAKAGEKKVEAVPPPAKPEPAKVSVPEAAKVPEPSPAKPEEKKA